MTLPPVVSREEWLEARKDLLAKEKELSRARDRLNADRRRLPMVRVGKPYIFEGPNGRVSLLGLFEGRPHATSVVLRGRSWRRLPIRSAAEEQLEQPVSRGYS